jgi:hypothetical protein
MGNRFYRTLLSSFLIAGTICIHPLFAQSADTDKAVRLIKQRCIKCHSGDIINGGIDFSDLSDELDIWQSRHTYSKAFDMLSRNKMPPDTEPPMPEPMREFLANWLQHTLDNVDIERIPRNPGFLPPRRLNRTQYNYTVQDLFGIEASPGDALPVDQVIGDSFDNEISSLTVEPLWFERAMTAASETVRAVWSDPAALDKLLFVRPTPPPIQETALYVSSLEETRKLKTGDEDFTVIARVQGTPGHIFMKTPPGYGFVRWAKQLTFGKKSITYKIGHSSEMKIDTHKLDDGEEHVIALSKAADRVSLYLDGRFLASMAGFTKADRDYHLFKIGMPLRPPRLEEDDDEDRPVEIHYPGLNEVAFFSSALSEETLLNITSHDAVDEVTTADFRWDPAIKTKEPEIISADQAADQVLQKFLTRAFRRPPTEDESSRYKALFQESADAGIPFDLAMQLPVTAALSSPSFLLRSEEPQDSEDPYLISSIDMANRLSYFLWSSIPDDKLMTAAVNGDLLNEKELIKHADRMLKDEKANRFFERFVVQWLRTEGLGDTYRPDSDRFPEVNDSLMDAMRTEGILVVADAVQNNLPLQQLLDNNTTFMNPELAKHYGYTGVDGPGWQKVALEDSSRGGLVTQAASLTVSSSPRRTSPVFRGKWVLEVLLGEPPPPPPPNVPELSAEAEADDSSLRTLLEAHRANPACAVCHVRIDPYGLALEQYDAVGRLREGKRDTSSMLLSGEHIDGAADLKRFLMEDKKEAFIRHLTSKMLAYALGRDLVFPDERAVQLILKQLKTDEYRAASLIRSILLSEPFRYRMNPKS